MFKDLRYTLVTRECGRYSKYTFPKYNTLCVGYNGKTSGCNGDSGGPLVCRSGRLDHQLSWSKMTHSLNFLLLMPLVLVTLTTLLRFWLCIGWCRIMGIERLQEKCSYWICISFTCSVMDSKNCKCLILSILHLHFYSVSIYNIYLKNRNMRFLHYQNNV